MPEFNKNTTLPKIMKVHIYVCMRVLAEKENKIRNIKSEWKRSYVSIEGLPTLCYSLVRVYVNLAETLRQTKLYLYKHRVILKWKWGKNHREGLKLIPGKDENVFHWKQEKRRRIEECQWKGKRERRNPVVGNPDLVVYSLESKTILTATRIHSFLSKSTLIIQDIVSKVIPLGFFVQGTFRCIFYMTMDTRSNIKDGNVKYLLKTIAKNIKSVSNITYYILDTRISLFPIVVEV